MYPPAVAWQGEIERLAWGGLGVGRAKDGRVILLNAPLALFPGESVEASIHWKARHGEGEVTAWTQQDSRREIALCPMAATCGGCSLREGESSASFLKRAMVDDLLSRQFSEAPPYRWLEAPKEARRHRIQMHWDGKRLGFHQRRSHHVVEVDACPAAEESISRAIPHLAHALAEKRLPTYPQRWELVTGTPALFVIAVDEKGQSWRLCETTTWLPDEQPITHSALGLTLQHRPGAFFQVCAPWAMAAFKDVLDSWNLCGETLYDLYGGVGLFSALLGTRFQARMLVEANEAAVAFAVENLRRLALPAHCEAADVSTWLPESLGTSGDVILLDPPRTGLEPSVVAKLLTARADALVLVGCDGAAFCRDIKRLAPHWRLASLAALDLFPLTPHVECIALMRGEG